MKKIYMFVLTLVSSVSISQNINIPDLELKNRLLTCNVKNSVGDFVLLNSNGNDEIEVTEALIAYELSLSNLPIQDLTGLEYFTNLRRLDVWAIEANNFDATSLLNLEYLSFFDSSLTTINVVGLSNLQNLFVTNNQLQSLDLTGLTSLQYLHCESNLLTSLDATPASNLVSIQCYFNQISNLDVLGLSNLIGLNCASNQLESLEVSSLSNLEVLHCGGNQLSSLGLLGLNLENLTCRSNNLMHLDVSGMTNLTILDCKNNSLESLYIKDIAYNGGEDDYLIFSENPNLEIICASADKLDMVQAIVDSYNYSECVVSECLLGVDEFHQEVFVYPNPAIDELIYAINDIQPTSIQIFDYSGRIVKNVAKSEIIGRVDVSDLTTGIYFIEFTFEKNLDRKLKFIKG